MFIPRRAALSIFGLATLTLGAVPSSDALASSDSVPRITRVLIMKQAHSMQLLAVDAKGREMMIASYKVAIGPGGPGTKRREGDMTTPIGRYHITMRQRSQYKIFLRLDYPTMADRQRFATLKARGELPPSALIGGDIGIHGPPTSMSPAEQRRLKEYDWTAGCIAVNDDEIVEVARLVRDGTIVDIED